jgi:hypothetical protein
MRFWFFHGTPSADRSLLAHSIGVFARETSPEDDPPQRVRAELIRVTATEGPGSLIASETRRVVGGVGSSHASLFAAPTTKGWGCFVLVNDSGILGSGCDEALVSGLIVHFDQPDPARPLFVHGFVEDGVQEVVLVTRAQEYSSSVSNNGFIFEIRSDRLSVGDITTIRLRYDSGVSRTIPLRF